MPDWMRSLVTELQQWHMFIKAVPRGQEDDYNGITHHLAWHSVWGMPAGHFSVQAISDTCATRQKFGLMSTNRHGNETFQGRVSDCQASHSAPMLLIWVPHVPTADQALLWGFSACVPLLQLWRHNMGRAGGEIRRVKLSSVTPPVWPCGKSACPK